MLECFHNTFILDNFFVLKNVKKMSTSSDTSKHTANGTRPCKAAFSQTDCNEKLKKQIDASKMNV